jgi:hypothetical protein
LRNLSIGGKTIIKLLRRLKRTNYIVRDAARI